MSELSERDVAWLRQIAEHAREQRRLQFSIGWMKGYAAAVAGGTPGTKDAAHAAWLEQEAGFQGQLEAMDSKSLSRDLPNIE